MKKIKGYIERHGPIILSVLFFCFLILRSVSPNEIPNLKDLLNASINIGAISVGFLVTVVTLIIAIKDNPNLKHLSSLYYSEDKTYLILLIEYLKKAIGISFFVSLISTGALMFDQEINSIVFVWYFRVWATISVLFLSSLYRIIKILSLLLTDYMSSEEK